MGKSSIKFKLLFIIGLGIIMSFIILGVNTVIKNFNSEYENIKKEEILLSTNSARYIDSFFKPKLDLVDTYAKKLSLNGKIDSNNEELINSLNMGKESGDFVDLYIGVKENGYLVTSKGIVLTPQKNNYDARKRPWYKNAISSNKIGITAPYIDKIKKKLVVTVSSPIKRSGETIGVLAASIFMEDIVKTVLNVKLKETGYAYLVDENSSILLHKNKEVLNKKDSLFSKIKTDKNSSFQEIAENDLDLLTAYSLVPSINWYLVVRLNKQEIKDEIMSNIISMIMIYVILLVIILVVIYITLKKLLAPMEKVQEGLNFFFRYLKGEEKQINTLNVTTNDEFGIMGKILDKEMKSIETSFNEDRILIEEVKSVVDNVNNGKLDIQVQKSTSNKALNELKDILNEMIETINENVNSDINPILKVLEEYSKLDFTHSIQNPDGKISRGLNNLNELITSMLKESKVKGLNLNKNAQTLLSNVDILNTSSNQTAASLEETAAAIEEITSTIINNTNRIAQMSEYSKELIDSISKGQNLANSTVTSMDEINEQTQAIADAITVIDQIAFQTNILSLNAAVEAATAGEAGKGFAVVAQEVRNLASRSAEAAKEIKDLVESATLKTNNGKNIADDMIKGYTKLNEDIEKTTAIINDISEASREQQISIEQINDVVNKLDQETQKNASVASQTQNIAQNTSAIATEILEEVNNKKFRD